MELAVQTPGSRTAPAGVYKITVRLCGVDCAEMRSKDPVVRTEARRCTEYAQRWFVKAGKRAQVQVLGNDKYGGRYQARVWNDKTGEELSEALVRDTHTKRYTGRGARLSESAWVAACVV